MSHLDAVAALEGTADLMRRAEGDLAALVASVLGWMGECGYTGSTREVTSETLTRFVAFAAAHGVRRVGEVTEDLAAGFVAASNTDGSSPAVPTMHQRRSVLRVFFRMLHRVDPAVLDPTWALALPSRTTAACRPVTDDELDVLRAVSLSSLGETRCPSIVALAEAGAVTTEIAAVTAAEVDPGAGVVSLCGSLHANPRVVELTEWGTAQLARRVRHLAGEPVALAYAGAGRRHAAQASISTTLRTLFTRAGLSSEPDLKLASVRAWAGRRGFDRSGRIDHAAAVLGCRSLDTTARIIGWDWGAEP
jgi:site-specific recombinase XerD